MLDELITGITFSDVTTDETGKVISRTMRPGRVVGGIALIYGASKFFDWLDERKKQ